MSATRALPLPTFMVKKIHGTYALVTPQWCPRIKGLPKTDAPLSVAVIQELGLSAPDKARALAAAARREVLGALEVRRFLETLDGEEYVQAVGNLHTWQPPLVLERLTAYLHALPPGCGGRRLLEKSRRLGELLGEGIPIWGSTGECGEDDLYGNVDWDRVLDELEAIAEDLHILMRGQADLSRAEKRGTTPKLCPFDLMIKAQGFAVSNEHRRRVASEVAGNLLLENKRPNRSNVLPACGFSKPRGSSARRWREVYLERGDESLAEFLDEDLDAELEPFLAEFVRGQAKLRSNAAARTGSIDASADVVDEHKREQAAHARES